MKSALVALVLVAACGGSTSDPARPTIVATTSILGDIVSEIVGDAATVTVLIPIGTDPHDFAPSAADAALLRDADLIVANGLGLEAALESHLAAAAAEGGRLIEIGPLLDPVLLASGEPDSHVWMDPIRMDTAVELLGEALLEVIDVPPPDLMAAVDRYRSRLADTYADMVSILAAIPHERRLLVTGHDAFTHFASRFDFEVVGVVVPGGSTAASPGAKTLAALADEMKRRGIDEVFIEVGDPIDVVNALATEAAAAVIPVYLGSLGPAGSGAETYLGLLLTDAAIIADHLRG